MESKPGKDTQAILKNKLPESSDKRLWSPPSIWDLTPDETEVGGKFKAIAETYLANSGTIGAS